MVHVTDEAERVLKEYFKDQEIAPIRIFLHVGGWSGPQLAMVLDEPKTSDEVFNVNGFTMLMDKELVKQTKEVTVDYGMHGCGAGFKLTSEIPIAGGGGASCSC